MPLPELVAYIASILRVLSFEKIIARLIIDCDDDVLFPRLRTHSVRELATVVPLGTVTANVRWHLPYLQES